jgi:hypothetical protein
VASASPSAPTRAPLDLHRPAPRRRADVEGSGDLAQALSTSVTAMTTTTTPDFPARLRFVRASRMLTLSFLLAAAVAPDLVGTWEANAFGIPMAFVVEGSGACSFLGEPMRCDTRGDTLRMTVDGESDSYRFTVRGDVLTLEGAELPAPMVLQHRGGRTAPALSPAPPQPPQPTTPTTTTTAAQPAAKPLVRDRRFRARRGAPRCMCPPAGRRSRRAESS